MISERRSLTDTRSFSNDCSGKPARQAIEPSSNSGQELLKRGILTELEGFYVHQSGKIVSHTKGTGTGLCC